MKIAVTGGTGGIGRRLCGKLAERGHSVLVVSRHPGEVKKAVPQATGVLGWTELKPSSVALGIAAVDAVVHLTGASVFGRWNDDLRRRFRESRVGTAQRIVEAIHAGQQRPKVLVSASAVGYYGDRGDEELTEDSTPGSDFLAKLCVDWENAVKAAEPLGVRTASVRIGIVLARDAGALKAMLPPFRLGLGGRLGSGKQWMPWVHMDDLVGIFVHAVENEGAKGALNGAAPNPVPNAEFTRVLAKTLHRPAVFPVPEFVLRTAFGEFANFMLTGQRALPKRTVESGYTFQHTDLEAALRSILT